MPNYFYLDASGQKQGPINDQQLQTLAFSGIISPETPLETDAGHKGKAGQIRGLEFPESMPKDGPEYQMQQRKSRLPEMATYSQPDESTGTPWLFDFAFRNIQLPKNVRRVCTFIYICCIVTLAINGFLGVCLFNPTYSPETMTVALIFLVFYLFSSFIFLAVVRVACELLIVLLDWIAENKKASQLYVEEQSRRK